MSLRPILSIRFYRNESGHEPVRAWLKGLTAADRKAIGDDLRTLQFGWPLGMPLVRKLEDALWETRTQLKDRIARVLMTIHDGEAILLHGFIKTTRKMPHREIVLARRRRDQL